MADMRLFSSFICQEKNGERQRRPGCRKATWFRPYRRALAQALLGRRSAVSTAIRRLLTGGVPGVVLLVRGVDILLPRHRGADL